MGFAVGSGVGIELVIVAEVIVAVPVTNEVIAFALVEVVEMVTVPVTVPPAMAISFAGMLPVLVTAALVPVTPVSPMVTGRPYMLEVEVIVKETVFIALI